MMKVKDICTFENPNEIRLELIKERKRERYYEKKSCMSEEDRERRRILRNNYYKENRERINKLKSKSKIKCPQAVQAHGSI